MNGDDWIYAPWTGNRNISQNEHAALAGSVARSVPVGNKYVFEEETEIAVRVKSW